MTAETLLWQDECMRHGLHAPEEADGGVLLTDKDEAPLARHLNVIVPVSFACVGEAVIASAYPSVRSVTAAFFEKYRSADTLFSDAAFAALDAALRPYLASWGYRPSAFPSRYGISLVQDDVSAVNTAAILCGTARMTEAMCGLKNHTSMKSDDCIRRGAFAHLVRGEIVCIASVNRVSGVGRCVEIGVECAPAHRRQGYARSCVSALTGALCAEGQTVLYRHYHTNAGSAATARSAGFRPVGRFFSYTSFAI